MKKIITLLVFCFSFIPTTIASDYIFSDVIDSHINGDAIQTLKDDGIIEGYPDGTYLPYKNINRAEFTKILVGALTDNPQGSECFPDVHEEWFAKYVCEAENRKIIEGYPDGEFKPADEINFSEAAKIIANSFDIEGEGSTDSTRWFKEYVSALEGENAIPLSIEFFDEDISRDEMAEIIWRIKDDVEDKASRTYDEINGEGFVTVESCSQLEERYKAANEGRGELGGGGGMLMMDAAVETADAPAPMAEETAGAEGEQSMAKSAAKDSSNASDDYSTTNLQVEGVDEADVIKNDGKYIYLIKGSTIRIVEAYPAENLDEIVSFSLGDDNEDFYPREMYVDGDQLIAIGSISKHYEVLEGSVDEMIYPSYQYSNRVKVFVVDIADRAAPTVSRSVEFDGNYSTSRKVNDTLYMVMNQYAYYPYYYDAESVTEANIIPYMLDSVEGEEEKIAKCSDIQILPKVDSFNFLITAAVPLKNEEAKVARNVIVGNSENVYASRSAMYVAATDWSGGYYKHYSSLDTAVYKFALGINSIEFDNKGSVPGTILNQFSMDEHAGYFRIATTKDNWSSGEEMSNNLYILDEDMDLAGDIENIAPGERIYSVRFMGDRAYMVTFQQVDPLFVFDLSNPEKPEIVGELKIPGYSNYLHPYDENHLIGFGIDVDVELGDEMDEDDFVLWEQVQGMKIGIFDVTDVNNPKEMYTEIIGAKGTTSELLYNHKALLFDEEKDLLAFPVSVFEYPDYDSCTENTYSSCPESCRKICVPSECTYDDGITVCTADCDGENSCIQEELLYGQKVFEGAYVYDLNLEDGFTLKGKIDHHNEDDLLDLSETGWVDYSKMIKRIVYIGENLYTISQHAVKANAMDDLEELNMVELAGDSNYLFWEY